ncbi:hypothetical protein COE08_21530 [Priestia megaterium]|uniref:hypothetical protein n=1 Tax=Priestia megaterium TaxID=1404 RepID=UPI000BFE3ABD|nr:hypothetical protein [Priestia megaterium]PGX17463.1 hypothetical protein COE08_21530 [Priestia megaterium]
MEKENLNLLPANNDINQIQLLIDLVQDEYGNYYYPNQSTVESGKLTKVTLSHAYYENSFSELFREEVLKEYQYKHLGVAVQERLLGSIERLEKSNRRIFTTQDLFDNGTEVSIMKLTELHPRAIMK